MPAADEPMNRRRAMVRLLPTFAVLTSLLLLFGPRVPEVQVLGLTETFEGDGFSLAGELRQPLIPGTGQRLDLVLTNPYNFDLLVGAIEIRIGPATSADGRPNPGCSTEEPEADLGVTQPFAGSVVVPALSTQSLSQLGVAVERWPVLTLHNRPVNQDACQGAVFPLAIRATGERP
jgi:hypothetical protein